MQRNAFFLCYLIFFALNCKLYIYIFSIIKQNIILFSIFTNHSSSYNKGIIYYTVRWIGVTLIPCPKAKVISSSSLTLLSGKIIPLLSPLKSIPVFSPKANKSKYENNFYLPSICPNLTKPDIYFLWTLILFVQLVLF